MNISFDLDSTLIPNGKEFETEKVSRFAKFLGIEEIRKGTVALMSDLQLQGHLIHIYTTSFRSKRSIKRTFRYHGITINRIVNETENRRVLKNRAIHSSKFPPAFNFDIHIDDLEGVELEAKNYNFKMIRIKPTDNDWAQKIKMIVALDGKNHNECS